MGLGLNVCVYLLCSAAVELEELFVIKVVLLFSMNSGQQWHYDYPRLAWDSGFCFESHKMKTVANRNTLGKF